MKYLCFTLLSPLVGILVSYLSVSLVISFPLSEGNAEWAVQTGLISGVLLAAFGLRVALSLKQPKWSFFVIFAAVWMTVFGIGVCIHTAAIAAV